MSLSLENKEKISHIVIATLVGRFTNFPENADGVRNAPFHTAFLQAFSDKISYQQTNAANLISLSSWLHGLNTTLGQVFFENTANLISGGAKRTFKDEKISSKQKRNINDIITDLKNGNQKPDIEREQQMISDPTGVRDTDAVNFTADVFIEDVNRVVAIEIKSVKPNSGEMKGEKMKMLEGKAVLMNLYPDKDAFYYIGFPFDPTVDTKTNNECSFDKTRFLSNIVDGSKFFDHNETLIAAELWNFLSDETNTMAEIIQIINSVSTIDFMTKLEKIKFPASCTGDEYITLLDDWYLYSEKRLYENAHLISEAIKEDKILYRKYHNPCFTSTGKYDYQRFYALRKLFEN